MFGTNKSNGALRTILNAETAVIAFNSLIYNVVNVYNAVGTNTYASSASITLL